MDSETKKLLGPYRKRNAKLRDMGFSSYAEYLKSDLWQSIRLRVLERDDHECYGCGKKANTAHHACYTSSGLSGASIDGIWSLCGSCHKFIEFNRDGTKARIAEARQRLKLLTRLNSRGSLNNQRRQRDPVKKKVRCVRCKKMRRQQDIGGPVCNLCIKRSAQKRGVPAGFT